MYLLNPVSTVLS